MTEPVPGPSAPASTLEGWIAAAQRGDASALGRLLEHCRAYLLLIANQQLPADLRAKLGASDLVQETFLEAKRDFSRFQGRGEEELRGWLRRTLLHNLANWNRHFRDTGKRDLAREQALADVPVRELYHGILARSKSPSSLVLAKERDDALRRGVEQLSEVQRQVIRWRNYERATFEEIGRRLGRSAEAARKLWVRALERLAELLELPHDAS